MDAVKHGRANLGYGEQLVTNLAELLPKLCVVDLRCSGVDDTDVAAAIMTLDSREGACPVPVRAVADAAYRVCAENPRQLLPEYIDVRDYQADVNRADIARVRVEPPRVAGGIAQDRCHHIRCQIFLASGGAIGGPGAAAPLCGERERGESEHCQNGGKGQGR